MTDHMENWNKLKTPPPEALKEITGGRLSGMTDIRPQWRYRAVTEVYGPCGFEWKYVVKRLWTIDTNIDGQIAAFAEIDLYVKNGGEWSEAIPGNGGSMLVEQEIKGPHINDECFKMAVTDALSTAMKMIGVGSDVYEGKLGAGNGGGSKYQGPSTTWPPSTVKPSPVPTQDEIVNIESLMPEQFTTNAGKQMTRYDIRFSDGAEFKFIDRDLFKLANDYSVRGTDVVYETRKVGKFLNLIDIREAAPIATELHGESPDGELPPVTDGDRPPFAFLAPFLPFVAAAIGIGGLIAS